MGKIVYLLNDQNYTLYDENSVPKHLEIVEPDPAHLLRILDRRLKFLGFENTDLLCCTISLILPSNPVYFPTDEGITALYDKDELKRWFDKKNGLQADPTGITQNAQIINYVTPSSEEILFYICKYLEIEREFLVDQYIEVVENDFESTKTPLIRSAEAEDYTALLQTNPPKRSRAALLFYTIFCCACHDREHSKRQDSDEHTRSNNFAQ